MALFSRCLTIRVLYRVFVLLCSIFFSFGLEFEVQSNFPDNEVADMKDSHHKTDAYEKDLNKPLNDYKPIISNCNTCSTVVWFELIER